METNDSKLRQAEFNAGVEKGKAMYKDSERVKAELIAEVSLLHKRLNEAIAEISRLKNIEYKTVQNTAPALNGERMGEQRKKIIDESLVLLRAISEWLPTKEERIPRGVGTMDNFFDRVTNLIDYATAFGHLDLERKTVQNTVWAFGLTQKDINKIFIRNIEMVGGLMSQDCFLSALMDVENVLKIKSDQSIAEDEKQRFDSMSVLHRDRKESL